MSESTGTDLASRAVTAVLIVLTALALVATASQWWVHRTLLDPEGFAAVTADVPQDPQVTAALSDYATGQISDALDVSGRLSGVPILGAVLGDRLAAVVNDAVHTQVDRFIASPEFPAVWSAAVTTAHQQVLTQLRADSSATAGNTTITINLVPILAQSLRAALPGVEQALGRTITVPDIPPDATTADSLQALGGALGVSLPADFGQVSLAVDTSTPRLLVRGADVSLGAFAAVSAVLLVLLLLLAPRRRSAVLWLGVAVAGFALIELVVIRVAPGAFLGDGLTPVADAVATATADALVASLTGALALVIGLGAVTAGLAAAAGMIGREAA